MSEGKATRKPAKGATTKKDANRATAKRRTGGGSRSEGFTAEERAAMKERARELKTARRPGRKEADAEREVLAKIAEMPAADRALGKRLHAIVKASAPDLAPRLWYGMPAYAIDGQVVCFFQGAKKFTTRYATFAFSDAAKLDKGSMWPTAFALAELTPADEAKIAALVKRAVR
jgi:uncharacterized protein YdhG (YjbR/CyaY superfamily)